jgi:DNA modification methylase
MQHSRLIVGDSRVILPTLQDCSIDCCITSPPYFGLRDYGINGQIGLEPTPEAFVAKMVGVFREVRRVLRDDGTLWLNLGDSYNSAASGQNGISGMLEAGKPCAGNGTTAGRRSLLENLKPKDLIGIPWRVAFALQADGWYLRQDIIWHKPNPMPESVRDRCTKAHEYIFLLSKSERYFFDSEAMKEPSVTPADLQVAKRNKAPHKGQRDSGMRETTGGFDKITKVYETRNRRSVWTVATRPYKGAHFATFPPALIEPCVLAGSRPGDVVLDPFMGSGTTAAVAKQHGRQYIGCELNEAYWPLQEERIRAIA